ncbi:MAG TPA: hypothetical protein VHM72_04935 [Solirubrobacteraceae bacterium]|jgi:hypothetical protein|nr:hypothetical protein [Solirubrobacteraceae bacterium]
MSKPFAAAGDGASTASTSADAASSNGGPPPAGTQPGGVIGSASSLVANRPEIALAAAFAGGVVLAILARRLGR